MSVQGSGAQVGLSLSLPEVSLYNSLGVKVAQGSLVGGQSVLSYGCVADGTYYVAVGSVSAASGGNLCVDGSRGISDSILSSNMSYATSKAFDGNEGSFWASNTSGGGSAGVAWLGYDFGAGNSRSVGLVRLLNYDASWAPSSVRLQNSADGVIWSEQGTFGIAQSNQWQSFENASGDSARYWRVLANSAITYPWVVKELQMLDGSNPEAGGGYQASLAARDDYAASTTASLAVPTDTTIVTISGALESDADRDWIKVAMTAGNAYHFDLYGSGASPLADPSLYLYDSAGALLASNDNHAGGLNSHLDWDPASTGNYYVGVGSSADVGTGTYTLEAWDPPIAAQTADLSEALESTLSQVLAAGSQAVQDILAASLAEETTAAATPAGGEATAPDSAGLATDPATSEATPQSATPPADSTTPTITPAPAATPDCLAAPAQTITASLTPSSGTTTCASVLAAS
ncbi:MAG: pre-peptidase C-terminal domain-containing protein [Desulfarculus sp.]|nr:pre-peptidase C-terminal domain-containing protein [Desulfarculus sp.]